MVMNRTTKSTGFNGWKHQKTRKNVQSPISSDLFPSTYLSSTLNQEPNTDYMQQTQSSRIPLKHCFQNSRNLLTLNNKSSKVKKRMSPLRQSNPSQTLIFQYSPIVILPNSIVNQNIIGEQQPKPQTSPPSRQNTMLNSNSNDYLGWHHNHKDSKSDLQDQFEELFKAKCFAV